MGAGFEAEALAEAAEETTVIGRLKDLEEPGPGEQSLLDRLPDMGSPKSELGRKFGRASLRDEPWLTNS